MRFMLNWLFTSIAIAIATFLVPGIQPFGFAEAWVCFAFVGLFLNIVDSLVKPFLTVISLPLTIITLGIFQLVVNSLADIVQQARALGELNIRAQLRRH